MVLFRHLKSKSEVPCTLLVALAVTQMLLLAAFGFIHFGHQHGIDREFQGSCDRHELLNLTLPCNVAKDCHKSNRKHYANNIDNDLITAAPDLLHSVLHAVTP